MTLGPRQELDALLVQEERLASPAAFMVWASGGRRKAFRHVVVVSDEIVGMVERDTCDVLLVEIPVRHGKSELCSVFTPAWFKASWPDQPVLLAGYEADFAAQWGRRARAVLEEVGPGVGVRVSKESSSAKRWALAGHADAPMRTAGAGGPLTGMGGALIVVDDPIKNAEEAQSQSERDKLWEWFEKVLLTRRQGIGKILVVMSRWHHDDLVGRLKATPGGLRVRSVRLPAEAEEGDPLGREVGEPLCPELVTAEHLAQAKQTSAWSSLYQQSPMAAEGAMFSEVGLSKRFAAVTEVSETGEKRTVFVVRGETGDKVWSASASVTCCSVGLANAWHQMRSDCA